MAAVSKLGRGRTLSRNQPCYYWSQLSWELYTRQSKKLQLYFSGGFLANHNDRFFPSYQRLRCQGSLPVTPQMNSGGSESSTHHSFICFVFLTILSIPHRIFQRIIERNSQNERSGPPFLGGQKHHTNSKNMARTFIISTISLIKWNFKTAYH